MPKKAEKVLPVKPFFHENYFYNHGDNPAMKNFIKIAQANQQDGVFLERRTYVIDRAVR